MRLPAATNPGAQDRQLGKCGSLDCLCCVPCEELELTRFNLVVNIDLAACTSWNIENRALFLFPDGLVERTRDGSQVARSSLLSQETLPRLKCDISKAFCD